MPETTEIETPAEVAAPAADGSVAAESLVEESLVEESLVEESLVEEVSIDGMCGVY